MKLNWNNRFDRIKSQLKVLWRVYVSSYESYKTKKKATHIISQESNSDKIRAQKWERKRKKELLDNGTS